MSLIKKNNSKNLLPVSKLIKWYQKNQRPLPWRNTKSPYHILVSEVMLQQTTVTTVIPYYKKFIQKFKTLKSLSHTPLKEVLPYWSGLGYYSRIKNLHKTAQIIQAKKHFPKTYKELLKLPGLGSYTARAVSSLAFDEKVGVLDANVIRVLARFYRLKKPWWKNPGRNFLQQSANEWVKDHSSALVNQALMELGSLVCTPLKPACLICPLRKYCQGFQHNEVYLIQKKKPKKQIWYWKPELFFKDRHIALVNDHTLPVLKNYPMFPGKATRRSTPPKKYDFVHSITHHLIYVSCDQKQKLYKRRLSLPPAVLWTKVTQLSEKNPSSLIKKILEINKLFIYNHFKRP